MFRTLVILTAIFLVGTLAQCPSTFVLSTGVNGQTYYFNAFSPYSSPRPPTLFTDRTNATLFSLSSNGTAVAQVPATPSGPFTCQNLIKLTQGQVSTDPLLILYAAQNRQRIYPITVQCAADATVTFTLYGLDGNEIPVDPEVSTGFLACPNGDGGQLQLFNAGTQNHPNVAVSDINACITGLTVMAVTAEYGSSFPGATSSGFVTDSLDTAVSTRPTTAAWQFTNSTTSGVETGTAASGYAGSADTFNTNDAVIIALPTPGSGNFVPTTPIFNSLLGAPTPVVPIGQAYVHGIPVSLSNGQVVANDIPVASASIALAHPLLTVYEVVFTTTVEQSFTYECAGNSLTVTLSPFVHFF